MSLPAPYSEVYREGDGVTTEFSFGNEFKAISQNYVKCIVYLEDGYAVVPTYTVNLGVGSITISALTMPDSTVLTAPPLGSQVRIFRDVPEAQTVNASQIQSYTGKQLENVFDAIVAMIQEVSYTVDHKTVRLTEPQRDIALQELSELADNHLIYWDFTNRKLVVTNYPQQDVVQCVNGLFFRLRTDPDTQQPYLQWSTDNSDWHSIDVDAVRELAQSAYDLADSAYNLASTTRGELNAHKALRNNPHETTLANLIDTDFNNVIAGQFIMFDGLHWKNVYSSTSVGWGAILGDINDQTDLFDTFVKKTGDTLTGMYKHNYGSRVRFMANNSTVNYTDLFMNGTEFEILFHTNNNTYDGLYGRATNGYVALYPGTDNQAWLGLGGRRWKKIWATELCPDTTNILTIPNKTGTLATKADVDLAANSGRMITDQGVWFAKMYAATVVPTGAEYDGKNYADFSQVDAENNPVIKIYTGASGAWTLSETITPPAEYDGYVPITSKIWDIAEQTGQQGGRILWNHQSEEFTPYPQIISFANIEITGDSTVLMPQNPGTNQIVNKNYVDEAIAEIPTVDIKQSIDAEIVGTLTVADNGDVSGFSSSNYLLYPGRFDMTDVSSFEMVFAFTPTSSDNVIFAPLANSGITLWLQKNSDKLRVLVYNNQTSTILNDIHGVTTLSADTKYYTKVVYDGTNYTISLSTDGSTWNTEATAVATGVPGITAQGYAIGKTSGSFGNITAIHMAECYIKKDGILVWQGMDCPGLHQRVAKSELPGLLIPDYSQGQNVALTGITQWAAPIDCFVSYQSGLKNGAQEVLYIGNVRVFLAEGGWSAWQRSCFGFYMKAGQILTGLAANDSNRDSTIYYFPLGA